MTVIVSISHETGDLSQWTSADVDDYEVTTDAALCGNYGLEWTISIINNGYCIYNLSSPDTSGVLSFRFFIDPNSLFMNNNYGLSIVYLYNSASELIAQINLNKISGNYTLFFYMVQDNGVPIGDATPYIISNTSHYVEIKLVRATTSSSNNGYITWWIDGILKKSVTGKDNYDRFNNFNSLWFGGKRLTANIGAGPIYVDDFIINNTGEFIGDECIPYVPNAGGQVSLSNDLVNDIILNDVLVQDMISATVLVGDVAISDGEG